MAHGQRAAHKENDRQEYNSRRLYGYPSRGRNTKRRTHKLERRQAKKEVE